MDFTDFELNFRVVVAESCTQNMIIILRLDQKQP